MYFEKTATAVKGIGKYKTFYSEVAESQPADKFKPRNMRKVRCLLCTDGRTLVYWELWAGNTASLFMNLQLSVPVVEESSGSKGLVFTRRSVSKKYLSQTSLFPYTEILK